MLEDKKNKEQAKFARNRRSHQIGNAGSSMMRNTEGSGSTGAK